MGHSCRNQFIWTVGIVNLVKRVPIQHRSMEVLLEMKGLSGGGHREVGASILLECEETADLKSNLHHLKRELNVCK